MTIPCGGGLDLNAWRGRGVAEHALEFVLQARQFELFGRRLLGRIGSGLRHLLLVRVGLCGVCSLPALVLAALALAISLFVESILTISLFVVSLALGCKTALFAEFCFAASVLVA